MQYKATKDYPKAPATTDISLYYFSFSGSVITSKDLPKVSFYFRDVLVELYPPVRISAANFRPTPSFTLQSYEKYVGKTSGTGWPRGMAAFPGLTDEHGARINVWQRPELGGEDPELPCDTLIIVAHGRGGGDFGSDLERGIVRPLLERLRVTTNQWWAGRSFEGILGPLHLCTFLTKEGAFAAPSRHLAQVTTSGPNMRSLDKQIWDEAVKQLVNATAVPAYFSLAADAKYMLASKEHRSGLILTCSAFESARDYVKALRNVKNLSTSPTDLPKHLSIGFDKSFGRNLERENPPLFLDLKAFWIARGHAAHGQEIPWRVGDVQQSIEDIREDDLTRKLDSIMDWVVSVKPQ